METTWRVEQITEKPGMVLATLQRVEWFKKNPDYDAKIRPSQPPWVRHRLTAPSPSSLLRLTPTGIKVAVRSTSPVTS